MSRTAEGLSVTDALKGTGGRLIKGSQDVRFSGISTDSRSIEAGELFIALKGPRYDGHEFIDQALRKGAAGVISGRRPQEIDAALLAGRVLIEVEDTLKALGDLAMYWRGRFQIPVVAVTGSNGKTTTKEMIYHVLSSRLRVLKSEGNYNNLIGLPLSLLRLRGTHQAAVVEMGISRPSEMSRLCEIAAPSIGLITNVGAAHSEFLGDPASIAREKGLLFAALPKGGIGLVNVDDPNVRQLAALIRGRRITFGLSPSSSIRAKKLDPFNPEGALFWMETPEASTRLRLKTHGIQSVYNALAAAASGWVLDVPLSNIAEALGSVEPYPRRLNLLHLPGGIHIIDDTYNANPVSMEAALRMLKGLKKKQRGIALLGDMLELGDYGPEAHRRLGLRIHRYGIELLLTVGDYGALIAEAALSLDNADSMLEAIPCKDHHQMIRVAAERAREGDWILVKGSRGMGMDRVVDALVEHFQNRGRPRGSCGRRGAGNRSEAAGR